MSNGLMNCRLKLLRALYKLEDLDPFLKFSIQFSIKISWEKLQSEIYGKSKASFLRNLSTVTAPKIC